jgi:lysophospholipase L1-like esterase
MRREAPGDFLHRLFTNPVILAQANNDLVIHPNWWLGHSLPQGKEFLGEKDFVSFEETLASALRERRRVVLNVGDSSTSGWDSTVVFINRAQRTSGKGPVVLPFFRYLTYSDHLRRLLEAEHPGQYLVVNAGVPAHSSVQGRRRLTRLLEAFAGAACPVAAVSIYFGNNDCAWNANLQDKHLLPPAGPSTLASRLARAVFEGADSGKVYLASRYRRRAARWATDGSLVPRVAPLDYKAELRAMVRLCRRHGAHPLLIEPLVPLWWEPGRRVRGEDLDLRMFQAAPGGDLVVRELAAARRLWRQAMNMAKVAPATAADLFRLAGEHDWILPRIEESHRRQLGLVAVEEGIPLVQIQVSREADDRSWFLDYCHPGPEANRRLAEALRDVLGRAMTRPLPLGPPSRTVPPTSRLLCRLASAARPSASRARHYQAGPPPSPDIYTFY